MDPFSFTASLLTVSGFVAASCKIINDLRVKAGNVPECVERLSQQIKALQDLSKEMEAESHNFENDVPLQEALSLTWKNSLLLMKQDVKGLHDILAEVKRSVNDKSPSSKVLLIVRKMLSEKQVAEYQREISFHYHVLTNIQTIVCNRKVGILTQKTIEYGDENRVGSERISNQVSQSTIQISDITNSSSSRILSRISRVESANEVSNRAVLARLDDRIQKESSCSRELSKISQEQSRAIEINEARFKTVLAEVLSGRKEYGDTRTMLRQLIKSQTVPGQNRPRIPLPAEKPSLRTIVFFRCRRFCWPVGTLSIRHTQTQRRRSSATRSAQESTESDIEVMFVPPLWLTRFAIRYRLAFDYDHATYEWHWGARLRPLTINNNPDFIEAIYKFDASAVRELFEGGKARPTDYVTPRHWPEPIPWYEKWWNNDYILRYPPLHYAPIEDYLAVNGFVDMQEYIRELERGMRVSLAIQRNRYDKSWCIHYLQSNHMFWSDDSIRLDDLLLGPESRVHVDWISEGLSQLSEPLVLDEVSSSGICLIGAIAHADPNFRARVLRNLSVYRTPFGPFQALCADSLYEAYFSKDSIVTRFATMDSDDRAGLLLCLSRSGSPSMLQPFVDSGIDVDGGKGSDNMLGHAASWGNMSVVHMLLNAGANGALALEHLVRERHDRTDDTYKHLIMLLVGHARPINSTLGWDDPLRALIRFGEAKAVHYEAAKILLDQRVPCAECIGAKQGGVDIMFSYMYHAILDRLPQIVDLLIQHGAPVNAEIGRNFQCRNYWEMNYESHLKYLHCDTLFTWLTFSVELGPASSAGILIQHGADVIAQDGAGRSAVQLAISNAAGPHPRMVELCVYETEISDIEDAETLAVIEREFQRRFQGSISMEDYVKATYDHRVLPLEHVVVVHESNFEKALGAVFTPEQVQFLLRRLEPLRCAWHGAWSLTFVNGVIVRFFYVLSYILLLALELKAFVKGQRHVPIPSRGLLSGAAVLMLAAIWGFSLYGVPRDSTTS